MSRRKISMIGNTHIDVVWLWKSAEGLQEVKSSFASALERMKEFPEFKFSASSLAYFEWLKENCPEEFEEIKERVKEGRSVSIIITEQGNAVLADQRDVMLEGLGRALGELGDDELETYFAITEKILSSLEEYCEEGGADV